MSVSDAPHPRPGGASSDAPQRPSDPLLGRRVLIVEDDPYISLALEETLTDFGLVVAGSARTLSQAVLLARTAAFDIALLDVNIGSDRIDPVADAISARQIPFVFTTGCGRAGLPESYLLRPIIEKPFYVEEILRTLREQLALARSG
ncbi:response regulator [Methylocystis iwaonis]|uniref:response regulator n=1 Tax=Methylocystis iwaonis TaxID=2885079 RepID=UPI00248F61F2|nr:response regulator [Methylocystis iwaonis]